MPGTRQTILNSKSFDVLATAPLIVWYTFASVGIVLRNVQILSDPHFVPNWKALSHVGSDAATGLFIGLQVFLFLIRRLPLAKASGIAPRLAGFVGANLVFGYLALPRAALPPAVEVTSTIIVLLATLACIWTALVLGRSFSILPQARGLVLRGPYQLIRHPLYLAEQIGTWALMVQFEQPWSLLIALASLAAQFPRIYFEEKVLLKTFPEYAAYAAHTRRLIPGVY